MFVAYIEVLCGTSFCLFQNVSDVSGNDRKGKRNFTRLLKINLLLFNRFPKQALLFTCLQYKSFENTVGKGKIARNEQFLLFPHCFLPI